MKRVGLILVILCVLVPLLSNSANLTKVATQNSELVIYTYESLMADPSYDFIEGFANYSGISKENIELVLLDDANTVVSQAVLEKSNPVADVLIGIDNVLIHTAKKEGILESFEPPSLANVSIDLINNLDPEKFVVPYDYGIIALWYDNFRINTTSNPELATLTLQDIIDYNLDEKLVVEDPTLSSPGLGFLLWTIAVYGDPTIDFEGLLGDDWRNWWKQSSKNIRIAASWGTAFEIYFTEEENRPIMVSYGTSPAYGVCHPEWGTGPGTEPTSTAIVSHELEQENAWLQIEGIGLVKNARNIANAKLFIDWFLSTDLQDHISLSNWMYPANYYADVSTCFSDIAINPNDVDILNDLISPTMLDENLESWKKDWEAEIAPFSTIIMIFLSLIFLAVSSSIFKRRK